MVKLISVRSRVLWKVAFASLALVFGVVFLLSTDWPRHRSIEVSRGVFIDHSIPSRDFWFCLAFAILLFGAGGYLFWSAYLAFRNQEAQSGKIKR
jgi:hypothetical protein